MLIRKLSRFITVVFFCLLPFVLIAFLPDSYLLFFSLLFYTPLLAILIHLCFPQLGKSGKRIGNFKLFLALFFFVSITIILDPFMPKMLQEKFSYVILMVIWEVVIFMMIADGAAEIEVDEETRKKIRAEAEELFKKYHKDDKEP